METLDQQDQIEEPKARSRFGTKIIREILITAALAGLAFFVIQTTFQNFRVEGSSMETTLDSGQLVLVNKVLYREIHVGSWAKLVPFLDNGSDGIVRPFHKPHRGEVVVFKFPGDPSRKFIKRIIGVPGDVVEMRSGVVFLNGERLEEVYVENPGTFTMNGRWADRLRPAVEDIDFVTVYLDENQERRARVQVPEGYYWVLGDNRVGSSDSREWGLLPEENVVGKAWVTYWPLSSWGMLSSFAP